MSAQLSRILLGLALAAALLLSSAIVVALANNRAFGVMGAFCAAGLLLAVGLGVSRRQLVMLAAGFAAIIWVVGVFGEVVPPRVASTIAHLAGGALVGWALARLITRRRHGIALAPLLGVSLGLLLVVGVTWELAEAVADSVVHTNLDPGGGEAVFDLVSNLIGGVVGVLCAWQQRRHRRTPPRSRVAEPRATGARSAPPPTTQPELP